MKKRTIILTITKKFKHWQNKSWGTFSSLGKHIIISVLPFSYFLLSTFTLQSQTDTLQIDEVTISSPEIPSIYSENARIVYTVDREEIEAMPVTNIRDLLEFIANTDIRERGFEDVQADISIRAGNFDEVLILLNGFKISDVQTGHHNLNLPVNLEDIEKVEILEGPGNRIFGLNAYAGAVNFITSKKGRNKIKASIKAGSFGLKELYGDVSFGKNNFFNQISGFYGTGNGYKTGEVNNTDFETFGLFYNGELNHKKTHVSFQSGYVNKAFGANGFYTPAFPWQYEQTKTFFSGLRVKLNGFTSNTYFRQNRDRFELFREDRFEKTGDFYVFGEDTAKYVSGIYESWNYYRGHNYHLTDYAAEEIKYVFGSAAGKTTLGAEYSFSKIRSNILGEDTGKEEKVPGEPDGFFTKSKSRNNLNIYAEHYIKIGKISASGGAAYNFNDIFKGFFTGGIDLSREFSKNFKTFVSFNRSARLPTYTDLYYDGPTNRGNPDLEAETALNGEAGIKFSNKNTNIRFSVFKRNGKNTIDWVRLSDTVEWQTMNITLLNVAGTEFFFKYNFDNDFFVKYFDISYAFTDVTKQSGEYISKYALDYLQHKAVFSLNHKIFKKISGGWKIRFEDRAGSYSVYNDINKTYEGEKDYSPFVLTDFGLNCKLSKLSLFVDIKNIFDVKYFDFGNLEMPGRFIKAGITLNLSEKPKTKQ